MTLIAFLCLNGVISLKIKEAKSEEEGIQKVAVGVMSKELIEILTLGMCIVNVRPRFWPQFFTINVPGFNENGALLLN